MLLEGGEVLVFWYLFFLNVYNMQNNCSVPSRCH